MISSINSIQIKHSPDYSISPNKNTPHKNNSNVSFGNKALKEFGINMGLATGAMFTTAGFSNALAEHNILSENWVQFAYGTIIFLWMVYGGFEVIKLSKNFHKE